VYAEQGGMTDPRVLLTQLKNLRGALVNFHERAQEKTEASTRFYKEAAQNQKGKGAIKSGKNRFGNSQRDGQYGQRVGSVSYYQAARPRRGRFSKSFGERRGGSDRVSGGSGYSNGRAGRSLWRGAKQQNGPSNLGRKQGGQRLVERANMRSDVSRVFHNKRIDDGQRQFAGWSRGQSAAAIEYVARQSMVNRPKLTLADPTSTALVKKYFTEQKLIGAGRVPEGERMRLADSTINKMGSWFDFPNHGERIESLGIVNGSTSFTVTAIAINPGAAQTFGWGANAAALFEFYETRKCYLFFKSITGPGIIQSGVGVLAADYDVKDIAPVNLVEMEDMDGAVRFEICDDAKLVVDNRQTSSLIPMMKRLVRVGAITVGDAFLYDLATVYFATQGQASSAAIGELYVGSSFRYSKPTTTNVIPVQPNAVMGHLTTLPTSGASYWGSIANTTLHANSAFSIVSSGLPVGYQVGLQPTTLNLSPQMSNGSLYMMLVTCLASTSSTGLALTAGANCTAVNLFSNNGGTIDSFANVAAGSGGATNMNVFTFKSTTVNVVTTINIGSPTMVGSGNVEIWLINMGSNFTGPKKIGPLCEMFPQGKHYMPLHHRLAHRLPDGDWRDEDGAEIEHDPDCTDIPDSKENMVQMPDRSFKSLRELVTKLISRADDRKKDRQSLLTVEEPVSAANSDYDMDIEEVEKITCGGCDTSGVCTGLGCGNPKCRVKQSKSNLLKGDVRPETEDVLAAAVYSVSKTKGNVDRAKKL